MFVQGDTWIDRAHGLHLGGSQLGHGDTVNAKDIRAVSHVQWPAHDERESAKLIAQSSDEFEYRWTVKVVSCGLDHSAAVLELQVDDALLQ